MNDNRSVDLTLSNGPSYWWFRINWGTCTKAAGGTVSGIRGYRTGTYHVRAFSDNGCRNQFGATTSFTIPYAPLSATVNDDRSVDLTVSNGPSNWWFRINWGTCTKAAGSTVSNIQGYRPGTYRVRAFSDRNCAYQIAEASFTIFLDKAPLVAFYNATGGPTTWTNNTNWNTDKPLGEWHGVTTDDDGRVTKIILSSNNLTGSIPTDLAGLTKLQTLTLRGNRLTGGIPDLSALSDTLGWLNLERNELAGNIPTWLGDFTELRGLGLGHNRLSGSIPEELGNLNNLRVLYLDHQSYFRGQTIPTNFENIYTNDFYYLHGSIPAELGNLDNLEVLDLSDNRLSGNVPKRLGYLGSLETLNLSENKLDGSIPTTLSDRTGVEGPDSDGLGLLKNLTRLNLSGNQLSGNVPSQLAFLKNLETLNLGRNQLTGSVPDLNLLSKLRTLKLNNNRLTGNIPQLLGVPLASNVPSALQTLDLSYNQLSGKIPTELGGVASLHTLRLAGNPFSDDCIPGRLLEVSFNDLNQYGLPDCLAPPQKQTMTLTNPADRNALQAFYDAAKVADAKAIKDDGCSTNADQKTTVPPQPPLCGVVTNEQGRVTELKLPGKGLNGTISPALGGLTELTVLNLANNNLTGTIPAQLGTLSNLQELNLANNKLTGNMYNLAHIESLTDLNLAGNRMSGFIPQWVNQLTELETLDLSDNADRGKFGHGVHTGFSGELPIEMGDLHNLRYLDLSGNSFSGDPTAVLLNIVQWQCENVSECRNEDTFKDTYIDIDLRNNSWSGQDGDSWRNFTGKVVQVARGKSGNPYADSVGTNVDSVIKAFLNHESLAGRYNRLIAWATITESAIGKANFAAQIVDPLDLFGQDAKVQKALWDVFILRKDWDDVGAEFLTSWGVAPENICWGGMVSANCRIYELFDSDVEWCRATSSEPSSCG